MTESIVMVLIAMLIGQIVLSVPVLLLPRATRVYRLPLVLFLCASGVLALNAIVPVLLPSWYQVYTVLGFPMLFVLCPALRLYIEGITTQKRWILNRAKLSKFVLLWPAVLISGAVALLPAQHHRAMFVTDDMPAGPYVVVLACAMLVLMCFWLLECGFTLLVVIRRLARFNAQLKESYSNLDSPKLTVIRKLIFIAVCIWIFVLVSVFLSSLLEHALLSRSAEVFVALVLIWSVTFFAMQQTTPLLQPQPASKVERTDAPTLSPSEDTGSKYHKSALDECQSARIVEKITQAMQNSKLYLDADLTLQKLSQASGISPNYLSQALNETLKMNFFDFVNHWRIKASKSRLLSSDESVLNIALEVGFNARSSFYKAFKKETGMTPGQFRREHANPPTCD
ncbi:AraC family transcriptional regulator [Pseudoalteromonas rubra]|uniref:helix-turn-helix domain-containing protein n=1 Tax=Pseudoalteromonas rubra TaxID=43658 RepID=UPI002DBBF6C0|nr:AraC family transcriptional regulator [Pseudoalteromonas rubra]MEC4090807.1 AraC family transcriptional regulator [Pseudoalteromonas rubra]